MVELIEPWLGYGVLASLVLASVWLLRARSRGRDAVPMAVACLCLAGLFFGQMSGWPLPARAGLGLVLGLAIVVDVYVRAARSKGSAR